MNLCELNYHLGNDVYLDGRLMQTYARDCTCTITPTTMHQSMTYESIFPQTGSSTQCDQATFNLNTGMTSSLMWNCSTDGFRKTVTGITTTSPWKVRMTKTSSGLQLTKDIDTGFCLRVSGGSASKLAHSASLFLSPAYFTTCLSVHPSTHLSIHPPFIKRINTGYNEYLYAVFACACVCTHTRTHAHTLI